MTWQQSKINRIMIIGQPGSGKSTLARELGERTGLPVYHIDQIHWQSGWRERSGPRKDQLCAEIHAKERWIFEGGRSSTWAQRLDRADVLIWLDIPVLIRFYRVFTRTIKYRGQSRPDLPVGCPERFNWEFTHFIWRTRNTNRQRMQQLFDSAPEQKQRYLIRNNKDIQSLFNALSQYRHNH